MTQQNVPIPPITEVDLALFSEGLLTPQRSAQVRQFLSDHPELSELVWLDQPTSSNDILAADSVAASKEPKRDTRRRSSVFNRVVAIASVAMGLLILTTFWRAAQAVERTLSETETVLRMKSASASDATDFVPQVLNSRIALEQLENSFWLSEQNSLRRDRLLAAIYVTQAKLEQAHFSQLSYAKRPQEFPPLELCHRAIQLLQRQKSDEQARQILADAHQLRGQIHYLFGTMLRTPETALLGANQTSLAADSLLTALESLPTENAGYAQFLQISGLLFKTLHKGGLAGKLIDGYGSEVAASSVLLPRLSKEFSPLAALSSGNLSTEGNGSEALHQVIDQLGAWLAQQSVDDTEQAIAMMDICNSQGLRLTNGRGTLEQAVAVFDRGIQLAETIPAAQRSTDYWMTYGRLLGNMADAFGLFNQLEEEVKWRPQAIAVFRQITSQQRTEESFFELGWVTARQLIAEYRMHVRDPDQPNRVPELLGALRQSSSDLASVNGYQLGEIEDELVYAILAESSEDFSLGRGAESILRHAQSLQATPTAMDERIRSLLRDFRGNVYLRPLPEFQDALKIIESDSAR